ncbi:MAG: hypothetical protein ACSHYB_02615 [Roseibacillus sp.]
MSVPLFAEPTEEREWTSKAGTKLVASALEIDGSEVVLQRGTGATLRVKLNQLVAEDQEVLKKHFSEGDSEIANGKMEGLPHPQGEVVGPIQAEGGKYFLYVPKNLVKERLAPLLFFTGAGGGSAGSVKRFTEGAEVNGWIVAASVESKNGKDGRPFVKACLEHIQATLPVDPERLYFTGTSGGAVFSMINCETYDGAGAMPFIAHGVINTLPSKKGHYYFVNGATDYNRYGSSWMRTGYKDHAFHRFHKGAHGAGPFYLGHDGMAWLNGQYLAEKESDREFAQERLDYERAILAWAGRLQADAPHRALMHLDFLTEEYEVSRENAGKVDELKRELSENPNNVRYVEALKAIDEFSQDEFSGKGGSSLHKHTSDDIKKAASKLEAEYQGVPEVPEILKNLPKPSI